MKKRRAGPMASTMPKPQIAQMPQRRDVVGEEPVQRIGGGGQGEGIKPPPAFIALQRIQRADIAAQPRRIQQDFRQRRRVFQAQIQALPGDGMNAMGAIARQRKTRPHKVARQMEGQGIGPARPRRLWSRPDGAEAARQFGVEAVLVQRQQAPALWSWLPSIPARNDCPSSAESRTDPTAGNAHRPRHCAASHAPPWRRCRSGDRTSRSR